MPLRDLRSFEESGIYYVPESLLPVNPDQFVEEFGNKFVSITKQSELIDSKGSILPKIKNKLENNYVIIVTDPNLAELCWVNNHLKRYAKKGYVHNISEFNASTRLISIVDDMNIVQLPNNFSFIEKTLHLSRLHMIDNLKRVCHNGTPSLSFMVVFVQ